MRPERKPIALLASVTHCDHTYECVVFNLSLKGCNMIIDCAFSDLHIDQTVVLDLPTYGDVPAILRWAQPQEAGFEFVIEDSGLVPF